MPFGGAALLTYVLSILHKILAKIKMARILPKIKITRFRSYVK